MEGVHPSLHGPSRRPGVAGRVGGPGRLRGSAAGSARPPASGRPDSLLAAQQTAEQEFGLEVGGDYGGAWDLWTAAGRRSVSRAAYVRMSTTCPALRGLAFEITRLWRQDATTVGVRWRRGTEVGSNLLRYQDGTWRFEPTLLANPTRAPARCH